MPSSSSWLDWFKGANFAIYTCHFLSAWSGRMWGFSMGVFLISVAPGSLKLTAIYGLTMGACVLVFGTVVGDWVDRTPRLRAALVSMVLQNAFVITCACVVFTLFFLLSEMSPLDDGIQKMFYGLIIGLSVLSRLMKVGRIIVIERDWIVEIARSRNTPLEVMTSTFRRIDLLTKIFAPMLTGQILNFAGLKAGCAFIAGWSTVSVCVEYFLIRRVYNIVSVLAEKKNSSIYHVPENNAPSSLHGSFDLDDPSQEPLQHPKAKEIQVSHERGEPRQWSPVRLLASFIIIFQGFRTYVSYDVKWAGFALALLYLTVLGFDGITVGYATTQGLSTSILGILVGVGAAFGICATFTYPYIVRRLGLAKTGVLALGLQVSCLSLCVVSVFLPGSTFDLSYVPPPNNPNSGNCSSLLNSTSLPTASPSPTNVSCVTSANQGEEPAKSMMSVYVMMAGIVMARFGLWTADLTIIQLYLERVVATERGMVNGFQSSLNQMMDFFKYAMVAMIPYSHQFGLLIFTSFSFICFGWVFMILYAAKNWKNPDRRTTEDLELHRPKKKANVIVRDVKKRVV